MNKRKNAAILLGFVLSVSLIATASMAVLMSHSYNRSQFQMLGTICRDIVEDQPEAAQIVLAALKGYSGHSDIRTEENILSAFGYRPSDFAQSAQTYIVLFSAVGFIFGGFLFLITFWYLHRKETLRINALTDYLEKVNTGDPGLLAQTGEDDFSKLQDEIYKTVTMLYQTREAALEARNNFAENLSNIAHQLKTPITSISLSTQMMKTHPSGEYPEQIQRQLSRLTHLEEALLLLSRIDAGTLVFKNTAVDVFTVLMLAADNLEEMFLRSGVTVDIPELGEMEIAADLDWTMEAVMNLMKNCAEHTKTGGMVHCSYAKNPIYTEVQIWDEGKGFANKDIPRLFERFYRGENELPGGIGIGLSLAKEIIERQNGTISARNMKAGGACFTIRFYSH